MSTSLDEICSLLDAAKIRYGRREDRIRTGFETDLYEDREGDNCLHMAIWPEDDGETLRVQADLTRPSVQYAGYSLYGPEAAHIRLNVEEASTAKEDAVGELKAESGK